MTHDRLLFSDLHLKPESADVCFAVLKDIRESGHKRVGFLGDFWHMRYHVPVFLLNRLYEEFTRWEEEGIEFDVIPGNHDQIDVVGRNALEIFEVFPNVRVYTEPEINDGILWLPYRKDPNEVKEALTWARKEGVKVVFAHVPILGALQNNNHADDSGLPVGTFKGFRSVVCGHYHKRQVLGGRAVAYLGSPYQTRADEYGQPKGWALWSLEKGLQFVDRVYGKRYHRFEDPQPGFLSGVSDGDVVKVVASTDAAAQVVRSEAAMRDVDLVLDAIVEENTIVPRAGLSKGSSMYEYASAYVNEHAPKEAESLLKVFEEIYSGNS